MAKLIKNSSMTADAILSFYKSLNPPDQLPEGVGVMNPYSDADAWNCTERFYKKYFSDTKQRVMLIGINPGRFGGGITGIPFTDPRHLEEVCAIENGFEKRAELSSSFIYDMIGEMGGPDTFYSAFYISAVCPLGFVKDGKNLNYYDIRELQESWEPFFVQTLREQLQFCKNEVVFSIGMGANIKYLKYLNKQYALFGSIESLPHPRWVMQYRLKRKASFIAEYQSKLAPYL